jgi:hypothetical protein
MKEKFENHNLISQVQKEFEELKRLNLEKKARGERYDPHFNDFLPEKIGKEEAALWRDFKNAKTEEDFSELQKRLYSYREKLYQQKPLKLAEMEKDPAWAFAGFFGNQITDKQLEICRKKIKK